MLPKYKYIIIHTEKTNTAKDIMKENRNHFMSCFFLGTN